MFAVVEFFEGDINFRGKIFDFFSAPSVVSIRHEVPEGLPFFTVKIKKHRGQYPFSYAAQVMGNIANRVIFRKGETIPEGCPLGIFAGKKLQGQMLMNTAADYIGSLRLDSTRQSILIVDRKADFIDRIEQFLSCSSQISVITDRVEDYEWCRHRLMDKYGVCLHICGAFTAAMKDCTFVVSPSVAEVPAFYGGTLISTEKKTATLGRSLVCDGITLPAEYGEIIPEGIEESLFASALYELCGVKSLGDLTFNSIYC